MPARIPKRKARVIEQMEKGDTVARKVLLPGGTLRLHAATKSFSEHGMSGEASHHFDIRVLDRRHGMDRQRLVRAVEKSHPQIGKTSRMVFSERTAPNGKVEKSAFFTDLLTGKGRKISFETGEADIHVTPEQLERLIPRAKKGELLEVVDVETGERDFIKVTDVKDYEARKPKK